MNPIRNERYPNVAKAILALFAIAMVAGPSMLESADKKTRSHFTATAGGSVQDANRFGKSENADSKAQAEAAASRIRENEISAKAKLEKRLAEQERLAHAALEKRIEKEERLAREELSKRLDEEERNAVNARKAQLENKLAVLRGEKRRFLPTAWRLPYAKEDKFVGYLAYKAPPPLRFSDDYELSKRSPSAALPEFSMMAPSQEALIVETRLSEQEVQRKELLRHVVVRMEPHAIVSGAIDTSIPRSETEAERFEINENSDLVVRPEEVLIFFENQRGDGSVRTIVPSFSPALPTNQSRTESKATYRIE